MNRTFAQLQQIATNLTFHHFFLGVQVTLLASCAVFVIHMAWGTTIIAGLSFIGEMLVKFFVTHVFEKVAHRSAQSVIPKITS